MCVASTPEREKMIDGSSTKADIIYCLGRVGGGGIVLNPMYPLGSAGIVVNFTHVFQKCDTFQVWRKAPFNSTLGTQVNHRRKKDSRLHLCVRLLNELEGDAFRSFHLIQATLVKNREEENKEKEKISKTIISAPRIKNMCSLESNDPSFIKFRETVRCGCLKSIDECYGIFSEFTKPILTQQ